MTTEPAAADATSLKIAGLCKSFGGLQILQSFSLEIGRSELLSIIGPNGCGKTTLFNLITGTLSADSGSILFNGTEITGHKPFDIARLGISRKLQVPGVYPELTVAENIAVPLSAAEYGYQPLRLASMRGHSEQLEKLLEFCKLTDKKTQLVSTLSHGERQILEIAMVLATDPRLILLDEPTAGMSLVETENTARLILKLCAEFDKTVIVIEHDMRFVEKLACPVAVMLHGRIACKGSYNEIRQNPEVIAAYLGRSQHA